MRKYGKFEKKGKVATLRASTSQPEAFRKKELKNALLQTYFTSLVSLVLCVSLFFGTSYAWFTSEVTNATNEIHVGNLSVGLYKGIGTDRVDLAAPGTELFDDEIAWNPGYTMLETIQIENKGNLDFKYVLSFIEGKLTTKGTRSMEVIASYFDIWTYNHKNGEPAPTSYKDINEKNGWVKVGTLKDVLAGTAVLTKDLTAQKTDGANAVDTYTIAVHMSEGAGPDLMNQTMKLDVKLIAYQKIDGGDLNSSETDVTPVSSVEALRSATAAGKNIVLSRQIDVKTAEERIFMNGGVLDGAGNKITYTGGRVDAAGKPYVEGTSTGDKLSAGVVTTNGGVISNLVIEGKDNEGKNDGRALYVTGLTSDLTVSKCTLSGSYSFNINSKEKTDHVVRFTSCFLNNWTSYDNVAARVEFTDCEFADVLRPYGDTVLTNCNFTDKAAEKGLDVSKLANGERITMLNCIYKGQKIEKAVVIRGEDGGITITGTTLLDTNGDYPLRLK